VLARYLVLMNERLADTHNFPGLASLGNDGHLVLRERAIFFWRKSAFDYQEELIRTLTPSNFHIEVRRI